jgi:hypothetical protein
MFYPIDKANIHADCLQYQFWSRDLWDCGHRGHVEAQVEACWLQSMQTSLLISDPVTCQNKYNPWM